MLLMREIRFSLGAPADGPVGNSWAGWPAATGIAPFLVLRARLRGEPDPVTGYICNIKHVDAALRQFAIPAINQAYESGRRSGEALLAAAGQALRDQAPAGTRWFSWELRATPTLRYEMEADMPNIVQITQAFEFSASHRLHCPSLSDEENRRVFGKCNNPNGHGHNYQVEVSLAGEPGEAGSVIELARFEATVKQRVIDRLDHKHLNSDCPEFQALNPSVENITRVIWSLLDGQFTPARLTRVRVWETAKTYAELTVD